MTDWKDFGFYWKNLLSHSWPWPCVCGLGLGLACLGVDTSGHVNLAGCACLSTEVDASSAKDVPCSDRHTRGLLCTVWLPRRSAVLGSEQTTSDDDDHCVDNHCITVTSSQCIDTSLSCTHLSTGYTVSSTLISAVLTGPADWVCHIGTLTLCIEAVAWSCIIVTWWSGSGGIQD